PYSKSYLNKTLRKEDILLCMIGRFSEQKDQKTIINSLKYLPDNIKLILVGDGEKKNELKLLTQELGLTNRVIFMGVRNDIPKIYKTIDIPIISSNWEGFGLVAVEGMAAGKPIIASDVPGLFNIVNDYGLTFKKNNPR